MNKIDLNRYSDFVEGVTSKASEDLTTFMDSLDRVDASYERNLLTGEMEHGPDVNVPLLIVGAMGMCGEAGEFSEIVKKVMFHGKLVSPELVEHMKKELGDVIWYWTNACRALNLDPNEVVAENVRKLEARYPGGKFDPFLAENRKVGDI
jgi:NTP pyrophosphatase (non-canonical NTP hydrolase)